MKTALLPLCVCLLSACASSPTTQYFTLPHSHFVLPTHAGEEIAVRVVLTEPLKQNGLLYQTDALHLNFARHHLWAAPLDQLLAARFANELNRQSTRYRFVPVQSSSSNTTLAIHIEAFQGSYQGRTLIQGYSRWANGKGRNFQIETPQYGDGYAAMVESLSEGIQQAAQGLTIH